MQPKREEMLKAAEKIVDAHEPFNPVLSFDDFDHILKQAEGRMKAMQAQVGGGRGIPLHNVFFLIMDEAAKRRRELGTIPPNKMPQGAP